MASLGKSRWVDEGQDAALEAQKKREKEEKRRAKAERQRRLNEAATQRPETTEDVNGTLNGISESKDASVLEAGRPAKRRRLSQDAALGDTTSDGLLRFPVSEWGPCRHVDNFEKLNRIEEGSYGWVSRAREIATGEVVALKKLKIENATEGFPVTGLREIETLMASKHPHIVNLREVVMGDSNNE
jgi:cell division cycle 2-like